jgi:hypothetical protein
MEATNAGVARTEAALDEIADLTRRARAAVPDGKVRYLVSAESAAEMGTGLDTLIDSGAVYVAEPAMNAALALERRTVAGEIRYFKQLRPNVLVPLKSPISPEAAQALSEPLRREQIRVVPMFANDDVDALQKVMTAAGDRVEDVQVLIDGVRAGSLERLRGRIVIVVGHVEDGAFVARGAGGQKQHSVDIDTLERLAVASDTNVLSAGCASFCAGARAGFADAVSDSDMADAVRVAFQAQTNADLLEAFAGKRPLIVSQEALDQFADSRRLHLAEMAKGAGPVRKGALAVRLLSVASRRSALWEALETLGRLWVTGLLAVALMFRSSRAGFLHVFPKLPSPRLPETRLGSLAARGGRELMFIALGPLFAVVTIFTFFFGGWPHRHSITAGLWTFLRHPIRQATHLALYGIALALLLGVYVLGLAVLVFPALLLVERAAESGWAWYALAMMTGYISLAGWGGWRAHHILQSWLDSKATS